MGPPTDLKILVRVKFANVVYRKRQTKRLRLFRSESISFGRQCWFQPMDMILIHTYPTRLRPIPNRRSTGCGEVNQSAGILTHTDWHSMLLVGGLEHACIFPIHLGIIIPTDFDMVQRGWVYHQPDQTIGVWCCRCQSSILTDGFDFLVSSMACPPWCCTMLHESSRYAPCKCTVTNYLYIYIYTYIYIHIYIYIHVYTSTHNRI